MPNLSDILGYYGEDGESSMADYLIDVLLKSKGSWFKDLEGSYENVFKTIGGDVEETEKSNYIYTN